MTFEELLDFVSSGKVPEVYIDSRLVKQGGIFIAVRGYNYDGHDFIDAAIQNGAAYVVCEKSFTPPDRVKVITVEDSARAAGLLSQALNGWPAKKLTNLAVTGTNGKTTVTFITRSIIEAAGFKCGLVGTVVYDTGSSKTDAPLTTPDGLSVAKLQKQMVDSGANFMAIEASSHALSQNRLAGIDFKAAAFTNLTGDHLDYHKTEENYLAAKAILFEKLKPDATAILNKQSPQSDKLATATKAKILWYSIDKPADLVAHIESMDTSGTKLTLEYGKNRQKLETALLGTHNVSNILAAAGLCIGAGFDLKTIAKGISQLKKVPGRLEKVDYPADFSVIVDYAHTDDALKNVLSTLRPLCKGRLITVFGCGGDRDQSKRPRMAKIVEQMADVIIVTSDNPRTEEPEFIIGQIMTGFDNPVAENITVESDREKAIEFAIKNAQKDDIILIAGKGHENYQIIGKTKFHFDDKEVALKHLREHK